MSDKTKRPSGAEYRKRKKHDEQNRLKLPKIDSFFNKISGDDCGSHVIEAEAEQVPLPSQTEEIEKQTQTASCSHSAVSVSNINRPSSSYGDGDTSTNIIESNESLSNTDIGLFSEEDLKNDRFKSMIINSKPCRPQGPFPIDPLTNRAFSTQYYFTITKTGQKIERFWLCYSKILDGVYCEPCWLFANRLDKNFHNAWCTGTINTWKTLTMKIKTHEMSKVHIAACIAYGNRKGNRDIQTMFHEDVNKMREVLKRIIDVVITLSTSNLAFRGHRSEDSKNISGESGNFLNIIDLLSRYDPVLRSHIENENSKIKYLSPAIQNELISLASSEILQGILNDIQKAPFFSLMLDTTQDVSKIDQMSVVIRYVVYKPDIDKLEIMESFLGFIPVSNQSSKGIEETILKFLDNNRIDIMKCRGQGYDGASVMSGAYTGVQTRIKSKSPNAEYVHCASHNLNLVLNDSVKSIREIGDFYDVINNVYVFFGQSLPRWQLLKESASSEKCIVNLTLKKLCPTRWSSRYDAVLSMNVNFILVLKCLTKIILTSTKSPEVVEATGLVKKISTFDFIVLLVMQSRILENIQIASKFLQRSDINLDDASLVLQRSLKTMTDLRGGFDEVECQAKKLAVMWDIEPTMSKKRQKKVKTYFDELSSDCVMYNSLHRFKVRVFYGAIDILIVQLNERFQSMFNISQNFSFLKPNNLVEMSDDDLVQFTSNFYEKYNVDVTSALVTEVKCFTNTMKDEIKCRKINTVMELAKLFLIENKIVASSLPDLCTAFLMFLTLPVTVASNERSFSKLKLIKNYLRSSMSNSRLSGLSILSIEQERARSLDLNNLVSKFVEVKSRRGWSKN